MNRDFEIRQLLRASRSGIMSEAAFEEELTRLEHEPGEAGQAPISGFEACGRRYRSEREAVLSFIDDLFATQSDRYRFCQMGRSMPYQWPTDWANNRS
jgi:hypothetical protein